MIEFDPKEAAKYVVMTRDEVRRLDAWAIDSLGVPGVVLMENAGRSCAELIIDRLKGTDRPRVCIFCGTGNNGGDGFVIARHLAIADIGVLVVICGDKERIKGDARVNLGVIERMGLAIERMDLCGGRILSQVREMTSGCEMLVDAIFGTGLQGELRGEYPELITCINSCGVEIVAVDIPSGMDCDTGLPLPICTEATVTVTFAAIKKGFVVCPDAASATGKVFVASIGAAGGY